MTAALRCAIAPSKTQLAAIACGPRLAFALIASALFFANAAADPHLYRAPPRV